jgi:hypothetical protein
MQDNTTEKTEIESTLYENLVLGFMPYTEVEEESLLTEEDDYDIKVGIFPYFDYEIVTTGQWLVHIDIDIDFVGKAKSRVRTNYEVKCSFEHLFTHESLDLLYTKAIELCIAGFNDRYKKLDDTYTALDADVFSEHIPRFVDEAIKRFVARKDNDAMFLGNEFNVISIPKNDFFRFIITATFVIIDEVLYNNTAFDLTHNQEVFHAVIPSAHYYTVRFKCLEISEGDVKLVMSHNIAFHIFVDFAIQMLLDKHLDNLTSGIEARGLDTEQQQKFITFATQFLESSRKFNQEQGIEYGNLDERYDWNAMIK